MSPAAPTSLAPHQILKIIIFATAVFVPLAFAPHLRDQYTVVKWFLVVAAAGMSALCLAWAKGGRPPAAHFPPSKALFGLLLLGLFEVAALWHSGFAFVTTRMMDWSAFLAIAAAVYSCQKHESSFSWKLARMTTWPLLATSGYGVAQLVGWEPFPFLWRNSFPGSFFGFQNMTAEYVGLSLLFCLFYMFSRERCSRIVPLVSGLALGYLFFLASRAALFGIGLSLFFLLPLKPWRKPRLIFSCLFAAFSLVLGIALVRHLRSQVTEALPQDSSRTESTRQAQGRHPSPPSSLGNVPLDALAETKASNTKIRLVRWRNTWALIAENPMGIGPARFEFGYLPYARRYEPDPEASENRVPRSPHNAWLEATAESGWGFGVAIVFAITLGCLALWRAKTEPHSEEAHLKWLALSVLAFLAFDAAVAFPLENAFPFFIAAWLLGCGASISASTERGTSLWPSALARLGSVGWSAVGLFLVVSSGAWLSSQHLHATDPSSPSAQSLACRVYPENLRPCTQFAALLMQSGQLEPAQRILERNLERQPWHTPSLALLADLSLLRGRASEGCPWLERLERALGSAHTRGATMKTSLCH